MHVRNAEDPGSIPRQGNIFFAIHYLFTDFNVIRQY